MASVTVACYCINPDEPGLASPDVQSVRDTESTSPGTDTDYDLGDLPVVRDADGNCYLFLAFDSDASLHFYVSSWTAEQIVKTTSGGLTGAVGNDGG